MSILRIHKKQNNFSVLNKTCLYQKTLSWAAKGLHAYLISMPNDCRVKVEHLQDISCNERNTLSAALKELEQHGYIAKSACKNEDRNRFHDLEYLVYEAPTSSYNREKIAFSEKIPLTENLGYSVSAEDKNSNSTQQELHAAIAEAKHFEKLMISASPLARSWLSVLATKAWHKVESIKQTSGLEAGTSDTQAKCI